MTKFPTGGFLMIRCDSPTVPGWTWSLCFVFFFLYFHLFYICSWCDIAGRWLDHFQRIKSNPIQTVCWGFLSDIVSNYNEIVYERRAFKLFEFFHMNVRARLRSVLFKKFWNGDYEIFIFDYAKGGLYFSDKHFGNAKKCTLQSALRAFQRTTP